MWDGQYKIKIHNGMSKFKKQLSEKRAIVLHSKPPIPKI